MEKLVVFRDRQELDPADLNGIQEITRASIDRLVREAITDETRYAGLQVTSTSATAISVAAGAFVTEGRIYGVVGPVPLNLYEYLPVQYKRYIAIIASGLDNVADQIEERDFLVDADSDVVEPQAVPMRTIRQGSVSQVVGTANIDPQLPALPPGGVLVARILLGTAGIESVVMEEATRLPSLRRHAEKLVELDNFRQRAEPQIGAIITQMSALSATTENKADKVDLLNAMVDLARVKEANNLPDTYSAYASDDFSDATETDSASAAGHTIVNNVLGFASTVEAKNLQLLNPTDPLVRRYDTDWITPANDYELLFEVPGSNGDLAASSYQTQGVVTAPRGRADNSDAGPRKDAVIGTFASAAAAKKGLQTLARNNGAEIYMGHRIETRTVKQPGGGYATQYVVVLKA